jgi:glycosyltransferase involved in cell wall biosynthesis
VLDRLAEAAVRRRSRSSHRKNRPSGAKLRVAFLVFGASHPGSVIVSMLCNFAKHLDRDEFDVAFFVPEAKPRPVAEAAARAWETNLGRLKVHGYPVNTEYVSSPETAVEEALEAIRGFHPDILVTPAVLADYAHYYIAAARPATAVIGLAYGAPEQFSAPVLDLAICSHPHLVFESLSDCVYIPVETDLPDPSEVVPADRRSLGIADDAVMLFVGGRPPKLQCRELWQAWASALETCPDLFLVISGIQELPAFTQEIFPQTLRDRIRVFPWGDHYLPLMRASDIVADTYPFGGGVMIMEAMSMLKPTLTFAHTLEGMFDPMNWSAAARFVPDALVVPRGNFQEYADRLVRLVRDRTLRTKMGELCRQHAEEQCGSPARMVAACEREFKRALRNVQRRDKPLTPE